jgi:hypothetical protein
METLISKNKNLSSRKSRILSSVRAGKRMTLEQFLAWNPEVPGIKFEWSKGEVITEYLMKKDERYIHWQYCYPLQSHKRIPTGKSYHGRSRCGFVLSKKLKSLSLPSQKNP